MQAEAQPLIDCYGMQEVADAFSPLPCRLYGCTVKEQECEMKVYVVLPGRQHDRDLIGCEAAAMVTTLAVERLHPDIIINSGTCGAWGRYGMSVGKVYIGSGAMFHDRRVPGDNAWATQGIGNYPVWEGASALAEELQIAMGKVTTGSSFDMTEQEERTIEENGGRLKEMEGAAVAFVCSLYRVPVLLVKAVTNLRDAATDDMSDFNENLRTAAEELLCVNKRIIGYLLRKYNV